MSLATSTSNADPLQVVGLTPKHTGVLKELRALAEKGELQGAFNNIPIEVYHHPLCPGHSSTQIKNVLKSINHSKLSMKQKAALRFGNAFHTLILEPNELNARYGFVSALPKGYDHGPVENGKILVSLEEGHLMKRMADKLLAHPTAQQLLNGAQTEMTFFAKCPKTGLLRKCRADAIKGHAVSDVKTCQSADYPDFASDAKFYGYHISNAYYVDIIGDVLGITPEFYFIASEKEEPNDTAIFDIDGDCLGEADVMIEHALNKIKEAQDNPNAWKGYPIEVQTLYPRSYRGRIGDPLHG